MLGVCFQSQDELADRDDKKLVSIGSSQSSWLGSLAICAQGHH